MLRGALLPLSLSVLACSSSPPPSITVTSAASWPEADALFHRGNPAFLGADAAYSIDLHDGRILWLFGDTFVATSSANTRAESEVVRNTVAIQDGADPLTATFSPAWRTDAASTPASFFPEDGDRWHWPGHGVRLPDNGPLVIFLSILRATPGQGLGFAGDGWRIAYVADPSGPPESWNVILVDAPTPPGTSPTVGTAVALDGDDIVALAASDDGSHRTYLARIPRTGIGPTGITGLTVSGPLFDEGSTEASLHFDAALQQWIYLCSRGFGGTTLAVRTAPAPDGPWSAPRDIFTPPESTGADPFVYAGKAHPEQAAGDALAITYATNSFTFGDLFTPDGMRELYWPRFVRATLVPDS
jgi:hypothetical protein